MLTEAVAETGEGTRVAAGRNAAIMRKSEELSSAHSPPSSHPQNLKNSPKQTAKMPMQLALSRTLNSKTQPIIKMVRAIDSTRAWQHLPEVSAKNAKIITIIDKTVKMIKYNPKVKVSNNRHQTPQQPKNKLLAAKTRMEEKMMEATTSEGTIETTNEIIIDAGVMAKEIAKAMAKEIAKAMAKPTAEMTAKAIIIIIEGAIGSDAIEMQTRQLTTRRKRRAGRSAKNQPQTRQKLQQIKIAMREVTVEEAVAVDNDRTETIQLADNPKARSRHLSSSTETSASTTRIKARMVVNTAEVVEEVAEDEVSEAVTETRTMRMREVNLLEEVDEVIEETM